MFLQANQAKTTCVKSRLKGGIFFLKSVQKERIICVYSKINDCRFECKKSLINY